MRKKKAQGKGERNETSELRMKHELAKGTRPKKKTVNRESTVKGLPLIGPH